MEGKYGHLAGTLYFFTSAGALITAAALAEGEVKAGEFTDSLREQTHLWFFSPAHLKLRSETQTSPDDAANRSRGDVSQHAAAVGSCKMLATSMPNICTY